MSPIVADQGEAVSLHDERELGRGERSVLDPIRKLAVPDAVVPAQLFARLLHEVRDDIPICEVEHAGLGFGVELTKGTSVRGPRYKTNVGAKRQRQTAPIS